MSKEADFVGVAGEVTEGVGAAGTWLVLADDGLDEAGAEL